MLACTERPSLEGATFDAAAAAAAVAWIETYCKHTEGRWYGQPFTLSPWERFVTENLFGWKRPDGRRVYREAWIEIPRKNGKSEFAAALGLLLLIAVGEPGGQVYSIAGDESQARIVWDKAGTMVAVNAALGEVVEPLKTTLYVPALHGNWRPLSGSRRGKHGLSAHGIIGDEVHEWANREAYDAVRTSTGARDQPLAIYITTAGVHGLGLAWQLHQHAVNVASGVVRDDALFVAIWGAAPEDDWNDEEVWRRANPNLGISVSLDALRAEHQKARESVAFENVFRRLHLNQWTESVTKWLDLAAWDECAGEADQAALKERLKGKRCYGGLDLARVHDMSALALAFPPEETGLGKWVVLLWYWLPEDNMRTRVERDRVPYDQWVRAGLVQTTPGNVTDFDFLEADIVRLAGAYNIIELAYDRTFAGELIQGLGDEGVPLVEHGQGFLSMAAPTAEVERLVLGRALVHGGNPVLRWNAVNTVVRTDPAGNLKPDKEKSIERIDGMVATIMAVGRGGARAAPIEWETELMVVR